jgi:hypothetical protein
MDTIRLSSWHNAQRKWVSRTDRVVGRRSRGSPQLPGAIDLLDRCNRVPLPDSCVRQPRRSIVMQTAGKVGTAPSRRRIMHLPQILAGRRAALDAWNQNPQAATVCRPQGNDEIGRQRRPHIRVVRCGRGTRVGTSLSAVA